MRIYRFVLPLIVIGVLSACASPPEQEDETRDWSASKFYSEAKAAMADGNYQTAIRYFEGLEARYPFGKYALQSQLDVAYAYYKDDEPESALAALDRFIKLHPRDPHVDYAYYMKGLVNYNRSVGFLDRYVPTDPSQRDAGAALDAFKDFVVLLKKFPNSKYAKDARQRLVYLRNNLAKYQLHVARYYMKKGAWLAAANRAKDVVERFERTTAVRPALEIMVDAYAKLGMNDLAADARRVLKLNETKGRLAVEQEPDRERSLLRRIWDYIGFDRN